MGRKPTYKELLQKVKELEGEAVAEREQLTENLRDTSTLLETILDAIPDVIGLQDRDHGIIRYNHAGYRFVNMSYEEIHGKKCYELIGRNMPCRICATGETYKTKQPSRIEKYVDEMDLWLDARAYPILGESGEVVQVIEHLRDITREKRAERALRASEEKYKTLINNLNVGAYRNTVGARGRFIEANPAIVKMFGYENREEFLEVSVSDLYRDPRDRESYNEKMLRNGSVRNEELSLNRKDGTSFLGSVSAVAVRNEKGEVAYYDGIIEDVTEQKAIEEALKQSEERYRALVEKSPLGVSLIGRDGQYKYVNPKFVELFGYTLEEIPTGREWFRKAFPGKEERKEAVSLWLRDLMNSKVGESRPRTFSVRCKDGSEKTIHFRPVTMENQDQFVIYEDITEQKRLEAQFLQAQKMEAIGTLAGGMAHDFNNLLMGIQGRTSLMMLEVESTQTLYEHLKGIEEYIRSAAGLTKQLLGLARGGKYEVKPTDLNEIVSKSGEMFGRTKKEITIHRKLQEEIWTVEIDQGQIEQVLLNLYVNAWQSMPGGGDLYLETKNVELNEALTRPFGTEPGRFVMISVTDTGVGMDKTTQRRIFEPFFTTKEMGRGTGLGLASAYGIIKNHGGVIDVYSDKGHGATFTIYLPASEKKAEEDGAPAARILKGRETILLVDDEQMILDVGKQFLTTMGYRCLTAEGGKEAIDLFLDKNTRIDMVILDMVMPKMSGGETYRILKEIDPEVKVLLSSGYSIDGQAKEILELGCSGFIQKPFNLKELSRKLREILD